MSATGRNVDGRERATDDFYETPGWCVRAILPMLGEPLTVLDAGAGRGAILRECAARWPAAYVRGIESSERAVADARIIRGNFYGCARLGTNEGETARRDLVISNPPYGDAEAFARHALEIGNTVAFLLRVNWLASKKRFAFHRAHPCTLYVLPRRPSFTHGGTDATEYAWFVWRTNVVGSGNRWHLLDVER